MGLRIGNDVMLSQGVTAGVRDARRDRRAGRLPTICDGANIWAHATIVGGVRIGEGAEVGANSLVVSDVPDHAVVVGVPARKIADAKHAPRPGGPTDPSREVTAPLLGLREALNLLRPKVRRAGTGREHLVGIACSFTPLHLETFTRAYIARERPRRPSAPSSGIYGDLAGTIDQLADAPLDSCVVVVEWSDLDPRLGWREAVGAPIADADDVCATAAPAARRIESRLEALGEAVPDRGGTLPTLDLPAAYDGDDARTGGLRSSAQSAARGVRGSPAVAIPDCASSRRKRSPQARARRRRGATCAPRSARASRTPPTTLRRSLERASGPCSRRP